MRWCWKASWRSSAPAPTASSPTSRSTPPGSCAADPQARMQIVEFAGGTLRFLERIPDKAPATGFVWIYADRESLDTEGAQLQAAAQQLGGSTVLDLHLKDLANDEHPSHYDYTSVYDL